MKSSKAIVLSVLIVFILTNSSPAVRTRITYPVEIRKYIRENNLRVVDPPASASAAGAPGLCAVDSKYFYLCTAEDTWKRYELSTWTDSYLLMPSGDKVLMPTGDFIVLP